MWPGRKAPAGARMGMPLASVRHCRAASCTAGHEFPVLLLPPPSKRCISAVLPRTPERRGALCIRSTGARGTTLFFLSSAGSQCRGRRSPAVPSAFRVSVSSGVFGLLRLCRDEKTKVNE
jgi:hypothetical protein